MKKVVSAGGVVVRDINGKKQIALIKFTHVYGLSFPKGHVEKGESLEQAAIREVNEETGLENIIILKKLGVVNRLGEEVDGTKVDKDIHLFLMTADTPKNKERSDESWDWYDLSEALEKITFPEEVEFLKTKIKELSSKKDWE